jgi:hypothetical protein
MSEIKAPRWDPCVKRIGGDSGDYSAKHHGSWLHSNKLQSKLELCIKKLEQQNKQEKQEDLKSCTADLNTYRVKERCISLIFHLIWKKMPP